MRDGSAHVVEGGPEREDFVLRAASALVAADRARGGDAHDDRAERDEHHTRDEDLLRAREHDEVFARGLLGAVRVTRSRAFVRRSRQLVKRITDAETRGAQVFSVGVMKPVHHLLLQGDAGYFLADLRLVVVVSLALDLVSLAFAGAAFFGFFAGVAFLGVAAFLLTFLSASAPARLRDSVHARNSSSVGSGAVLLHVEVHQLLQNLLSLADDGVHLVRHVRVDQIVELLLEALRVAVVRGAGDDQRGARDSVPVEALSLVRRRKMRRRIRG